MLKKTSGALTKFRRSPAYLMGWNWIPTSSLCIGEFTRIDGIEIDPLLSNGACAGSACLWACVTEDPVGVDRRSRMVYNNVVTTANNNSPRAVDTRSNIFQPPARTGTTEKKKVFIYSFTSNGVREEVYLLFFLFCIKEAELFSRRERESEFENVWLCFERNKHLRIDENQVTEAGARSSRTQQIVSSHDTPSTRKLSGRSCDLGTEAKKEHSVRVIH